MLIRRIAAPLVGVLLAGWLLTGTRGLDHVARGGQLGPGFWPRIVLVGLGLACLVKMFLASRADRGPAREAPSAISRRKLAAAVAGIVLYVLATPLIGFPLASALFIVAFMLLCGSRSMVALGANAGVGTVLLLYLFVKLVYLPLPKGEGPFEALTLAIYRGLGIF
jgi:putative tricarboxylic transport membrane protein